MLEHEEILRYRRWPRTDGIEVMDARNSSRHWHVACHHFSVMIPHDWVSDVRYAGKSHRLTPGSVLCGAPGEVFMTERIRGAGSFTVLSLEPSTFTSYAAELSPRPSQVRWRRDIARVSPELCNSLRRALRTLGSMDGSSALMELLAVTFDELVDDRSSHASRAVGPRLLDRVRDHLCEDAEWTELATLSDEVGLSRFQVLRQFKKRFGLSPHDFQMAHRIAKGQILLKRGVSAARVALECGFADQSHFARSFKRVCGVTPGTYVKQS